jgi:FAD/FMN-containing dehydrogenase
MALSVKSGGHSYAAHTVADGGLLVDLSQIKAVVVDAEVRVATIEAGVTCGELDQVTQRHGLATPLPTVSSVGVAGAALGGGSGWLSRRYGLTLDNLISVDLVTADGSRLRASEEERPELFWALPELPTTPGRAGGAGRADRLSVRQRRGVAAVLP